MVPGLDFGLDSSTRLNELLCVSDLRCELSSYNGEPWKESHSLKFTVSVNERKLDREFTQNSLAIQEIAV